MSANELQNFIDGREHIFKILRQTAQAIDAIEGEVSAFAEISKDLIKRFLALPERTDLIALIGDAKKVIFEELPSHTTSYTPEELFEKMSTDQSFLNLMFMTYSIVFEFTRPMTHLDSMKSFLYDGFVKRTAMNAAGMPIEVSNDMVQKIKPVLREQLGKFVRENYQAEFDKQHHIGRFMVGCDMVKIVAMQLEEVKQLFDTLEKEERYDDVTSYKENLAQLKDKLSQVQSSQFKDSLEGDMIERNMHADLIQYAFCDRFTEFENQFKELEEQYNKLLTLGVTPEKQLTAITEVAKELPNVFKVVTDLATTEDVAKEYEKANKNKQELERLIKAADILHAILLDGFDGDAATEIVALQQQIIDLDDRRTEFRQKEETVTALMKDVWDIKSHVSRQKFSELVDFLGLDVEKYQAEFDDFTKIIFKPLHKENELLANRVREEFEKQHSDFSNGVAEEMQSLRDRKVALQQYLELQPKKQECVEMLARLTPALEQIEVHKNCHDELEFLQTLNQDADVFVSETKTFLWRLIDFFAKVLGFELEKLPTTLMQTRIAEEIRSETKEQCENLKQVLSGTSDEKSKRLDQSREARLAVHTRFFQGLDSNDGVKAEMKEIVGRMQPQR